MTQTTQPDKPAILTDAQALTVELALRLVAKRFRETFPNAVTVLSAGLLDTPDKIRPIYWQISHHPVLGGSTCTTSGDFPTPDTALAEIISKVGPDFDRPRRLREQAAKLLCEAAEIEAKSQLTHSHES